MKAKEVLVLATAIAFLGVFQVSAMAGKGNSNSNSNSSKNASRGTGTCIRTTNSANAVVDDMFKNMFQRGQSGQSGQSGQVQGQGQKGSGNKGQKGSGSNGQRGSGNNR